MKRITIITILMLIPAIIVGIIGKCSYTNHNNLSYYTVATIDEELLSFVYHSKEDIQESSSYILKVKCTSDTQFSFKLTYQEAEVIEVYKGKDKMQKGNMIRISPVSSCIFSDDNSINMGFVNEMEKGKEYLVMLGEEKSSLELKQSIYPTVECMITMIFAYDEIENKVAKEGYVPYTEVESSEVFADSQEAIDLFEQMKTELLEKYSSDRNL